MDARSIRKLLAGLTLLVWLVSGCGDSHLTGPREAEVGVPLIPATRGQPQKELPFRLDGDAVLLGINFAPGFGPPLFGKDDFGGRCSTPSDFVIQFALEGEATRLGRFTAVAEHCSLVDFQAGGSMIMDGVLVMTAANGDELWSHYERLALGEGVPEQHEFVGGTGRFVGASGHALAHPMCNQAAGTCTFDMEGVIVYDASDRS